MDIPIIFDHSSINAIAKLPFRVYEALVARSNQRYKEWIAIRHKGYEYYGRPLPSLLECIVVSDFIKSKIAEASDEKVAIRFLDKLPTLSKVVISGSICDVVAGSLLGSGFLINSGPKEAWVVETCPPSIGLVTFNTIISVQMDKPVALDAAAKKGSLERAFVDLFDALKEQSIAAICGVKGSGKWWTSERTAALIELPFKFVLASDFFGSDFKDPALYYIDGAEELCPNSNLKPQSYQQTIMFYNKLMQVSSFTKSRFVLGFREINSVDSVYMSRWTKDVIWIGFPDANERMYILEKSSHFDADLIKTIVKLTSGFLLSDLIRLINLVQSNLTLSIQFDLNALVNEFSSSVQSRFKMEVDRSLTWDALGGLSKIRSKIKEIIEDPIKYAKQFEANRLSPPRGLLLYGPPGCSKTSIAKAIANSTGLPFYSLDTAAVFSCYLGESERLIRELFATARQTKPSIIFFDEIEVIVGKRGGLARDSLQERLLATFLTEMDGIDNADGVLLIGATNRIDNIDSAFLRPGRIDHIVEVPLPDHEDRLDILVKLCHAAEIALDDAQKISQMTKGHSAADLKGLVASAVLAGHNAVNFNVVDELLRRNDRVESLFKV